MKEYVGVIKTLKGEALLNSQGELKSLKIGDEIAMGDVVSTAGKNDQVEIALINGKELSLNGNDTLLVDKSVIDTNSFADEAVINDIAALQ